MKKLTHSKEQKPNPNKKQDQGEIMFPFDSVKVFGGSMNQEQKDALYTFCTLNLELSEYQEGIDDIVKGEFSSKYYPSEVFFKNQYEKRKDTTISINVFAKSEKLRIEGSLEQVEKLMNKSEYSRNDTYIQALKYIEFLSNVINGQIKENELFFNPGGLPSKYNSDKLSMIFTGLVSKNLVVNKDKPAFLSIFTNNPSGLVFWDESAITGGKAGLFDLIERITGHKINASQLKKYFRVKDELHDNWRDKQGNPTKLIDEIIDTI